MFENDDRWRLLCGAWKVASGQEGLRGFSAFEPAHHAAVQEALVQIKAAALARHLGAPIYEKSATLTRSRNIEKLAAIVSGGLHELAKLAGLAGVPEIYGKQADDKEKKPEKADKGEKSEKADKGEKKPPSGPPSGDPQQGPAPETSQGDVGGNAQQVAGPGAMMPAPAVPPGAGMANALPQPQDDPFARMNGQLAQPGQDPSMSGSHVGAVAMMLEQSMGQGAEIQPAQLEQALMQAAQIDRQTQLDQAQCQIDQQVNGEVAMQLQRLFATMGQASQVRMGVQLQGAGYDYRALGNPTGQTAAPNVSGQQTADPAQEASWKGAGVAPPLKNIRTPGAVPRPGGAVLPPTVKGMQRAVNPGSKYLGAELPAQPAVKGASTALDRRMPGMMDSATGERLVRHFAARSPVPFPDGPYPPPFNPAFFPPETHRQAIKQFGHPILSEADADLLARLHPAGEAGAAKALFRAMLRR